MKYKVYSYNCESGECRDSVIREEADCPKCGLPVSVCREKSRSALRRFVESCPPCKFGRASFKGLDHVGTQDSFWLNQIRSRGKMFRMLTGRIPPVDIPWLEAQHRKVQAEIRKIASEEYGGFHSHSSAEALGRTMREYSIFNEGLKRRFKDLSASLDELLHKTYDSMDKLIDDLGRGSPSERAATKNFEQNPGKPDGGGKKEMEKKTKIFKDGVWRDAVLDDAELAEKADEIKRQNPHLDYGECLTRAQKILMRESGKDPKSFSEDEAAKQQGVPREIVDKLKDVRRGTFVKHSDGSTWVKVYSGGRDHIVRASTEGEQEIKAFQDERNFEGGRYIGPRPTKKFGYSKDGKTFTTKEGTVCEVDNDPSEAEAVERYGFELQFANELKSVAHNRNEVIGKTIQILRNAGVDQLMKTDRDVVRYAVRAAQSGPAVLDRAMRYTSEGAVQAFGSTLKALIAALV